MLYRDKIISDFLRIDSEMGLTFSGIALYTNDQQKRKRTTQAARKAYETVLRLKRLIAMTREDSDHLERNLKRLKSELEILKEK